MKNPVMYIVVNKGLGMSPGKMAAQVGHAVGRAFRDFTDGISFEDGDGNILDQYFAKGETKIVLEARDTEHLTVVERYINAKDILTYPVIDEGRTEVPAHSFTCFASEIVDKADEATQLAFGDLKTFKVDVNPFTNPSAPFSYTPPEGWDKVLRTAR